MRLRFPTAVKQASDALVTSPDKPHDVVGRFDEGTAMVTVQPRVVNNSHGETQLAYFVGIDLMDGTGSDTVWHLSPSLNALNTLLVKQGFKPGEGFWEVIPSTTPSPSMELLVSS